MATTNASAVTALAEQPQQGASAQALAIAAVSASAAEALDQTQDVASDVHAQVAEQAKEEAYISEWASRIDAYLAGSPLAGHGETFARAAYAYGVDPRWSPAISCIESTKGAHCFAAHNAWGWSGGSWSSWDEAIWDHVAGLASRYGTENSLSAAKKYCPPNYRAWYSNVEAQMARI